MSKASKENNLIYSRAIHIAALCCFLLPFFYTGCQESKAELELKEKAYQDSIEQVRRYDFLAKSNSAPVHHDSENSNRN